MITEKYLGPWDHVIVKTIRGIEFEVVIGQREMSNRLVQPLKKVIRKATRQDELQYEDNEARQVGACLFVS